MVNFALYGLHNLSNIFAEINPASQEFNNQEVTYCRSPVKVFEYPPETASQHREQAMFWHKVIWLLSFLPFMSFYLKTIDSHAMFQFLVPT